MSTGIESKKRKLGMSRQWKKLNPERHAELARAYRKRNPEKLKAQNLLNYAIRKGRIKRGLCEECGGNEKIHAHHFDYSKPYHVKWVCYKCHKNEHPVTDENKIVKFSGAKAASLVGADNPNAALSVDCIKKIRVMLSAGIQQGKIGSIFGVSQSAISKIKLGITYTNVK